MTAGNVIKETGLYWYFSSNLFLLPLWLLWENKQTNPKKVALDVCFLHLGELEIRVCYSGYQWVAPRASLPGVAGGFAYSIIIPIRCWHAQKCQTNGVCEQETSDSWPSIVAIRSLWLSKGCSPALFSKEISCCCCCSGWYQVKDNLLCLASLKNVCFRTSNYLSRGICSCERLLIPITYSTPVNAK